MQASEATEATSGTAAPQSAQVQPGRNIVLLSDGTGNSAGKLYKTNVWRLYRALELGDGSQLAFYDDGVGSSGFKPLQILGGAAGLGLARNVRDLYLFLCEHYRPPSDTYAGDKIYVFGFSRGAFTARILVDLITSCGILDRTKTVPAKGFSRSASPQLRLNTEEGVRLGVKLAYKAYRRKYKPPIFARLYRAIRDRFSGPIPTTETFRTQHSYAADEPIEAMGVWDTVAAYGLPIEEMTDIIDRFFYKLRFEEQNLNSKVGRAYHALALDDERHSFHPLLWNEQSPRDAQRIEQVWFAGMHADVGGGYPNEGLSFHSLNWMVDALERKAGSQEGLVFSQAALEPFRRSAAASAPMHDSRAGLGNYYRYKPRLVESLSNDRGLQVHVEKPSIHHSVLERIRADTQGYSPAGLPLHYEVIDSSGNPVPASRYESDGQIDKRALYQQRALRHIFWRRVNYFLMVVTTLALFTMPYYRNPIAGLEPNGLKQFMASFFALADGLTPGFLKTWTCTWTQSPLLFIGLLVLLSFLLAYAKHVATIIHRLSEIGWWSLKNHPGECRRNPPKGFFERLADWAFSKRSIMRALQRVNRSLMWFVLLLLLLSLAKHTFSTVQECQCCALNAASLSNATYQAMGVG